MSAGENENDKTYSLRPRDTLQPPERYASQEQLQIKAIANKIKVLKRKRDGQKVLITKKIKQIKELIEDRGSRTKIQFLLRSLLDCKQETSVIHEELMELLDETDESFSDQCMEEITFDIDDCSSEVNEYLISRKDDPPSDVMSKTSIVNQYLKESANKETEVEDVTELENRMIKLNLNQENNTETKENKSICHDKSKVPNEKNLSPFATPFNNNKNEKTQSTVNKLQNQKTSYYGIPNEIQLHTPIPHPVKETYKGSWDVNPSVRVDQFCREKPDLIQERRWENNHKISVERMIGQSHISSHNHNIETHYDQLSRRNTNIEDIEIHNEVDSWIDILKVGELEVKTDIQDTINPEMTMSWFIQQSLPRMQVPKFDGNPMKWIDFITKFKELVHDQSYLNNNQRFIYLMQHMDGEAKRALKAFSSSKVGYILALKRLKYMFGQRSQISQAYISKLTYGKPIANDDEKALLEYYYAMSDCIISLKQLNYIYDLHSTDVLRRSIRRLPSKYHSRWAEHCFRLRQYKEPSLTDLESWLQERILAAKESYLPPKERKIQKQEREKFVGKTSFENLCLICEDKHYFYKCDQYKKMTSGEKIKFVKREKLCFNCLKKDHRSDKCNSKNRCLHSDCSEQHHTSLHDYFKKPKKEEGEDNTKVCISKTTSTQKIFLQIVPVRVKSSNGMFFQTYALLDNGSESTLIRADFARKLKLNGKKRSINVSSIKDTGETVRVHEVAIEVRDDNNTSSFVIKEALAIEKDKFHMPSQQLPLGYQSDKTWDYLHGLHLVNIEANKVTMAIGADVPAALIQLHIRRGKQGQPLAVRTPFGWAIFGSSKTQVDDINEQVSVNLTFTSELNDSVRKFWELDSKMEQHHNEVGLSQQDKECMKKLETNTKLVDGKYEVPMLWINDDVKLPNNYHMALRRFKLLKNRLKRDTELREKYEKTMQVYIDKGYARKMSTKEISKTSQRSWYLPHHPVFDDKKPGKIRVVFDAAGVCNGTSLNKSLLTGPDLLNNLVGVLLRFRKHKIAIAADIKAMYHQVKLKKKNDNT